MEVKSFKDSAKNVVKIGDTVGFINLKGEVILKGTVNFIKKEGYFITVYLTEMPRYKFYPSKLIKL